MLEREPASFWRKNVIAVVILLWIWWECRSGRNEISNVRSFTILRSGEGLTSFNIDNSANFSNEKKYLQSFPWCPFFENTWQGAKKFIFTACHSGKLKREFTSPDVISTNSKSFLTSGIDFTVCLSFEFLKKHHLPMGQVKNRIH